ncbi:15163_t:CDS:2 [Funneliformis caledonium]|uniref:15163_t:CDS:1 n=1 Tax=Funneliformis caledonium TaxID=1117310 RepID=A0A9N9B7V4_9GLOM|nr:15163_t:CDS:2 [Funneliformis caledonium]
MSDFEFTYIDFEECNTNTSEKSNKDNIDQIAFATLAIFNNETIDKSSSEMKVVKLPSKLLVRTAMRMGKVELNRLMERLHMIILEKALFLCSEI